MDWYLDRQDHPCTGGQASLGGDETNSRNVGKSHPMERGLIACSGDHCRLTDKNGSGSTTVQVSDNTHG